MRLIAPIPDGPMKVLDGIRKVSNGPGNVSDGLEKVLDGLGNVLDGLGPWVSKTLNLLVFVQISQSNVGLHNLHKENINMNYAQYS